MDKLSYEERQELLEGPAGPPPPGIVSNFIDPPNMKATGHAVFVTLCGFATICFFLRLYAAAFVVRKFKKSDYAMIMAWALCMGYSAVEVLVTRLAPGVDKWNLRLKDLISLLYYRQVRMVVFGFCSFFIKCSILLQLLEVFAQSQRDFFFWSCHFLIWLNFTYHLIGTFITIFSCRPITKAWNILITHGSCLDIFRLIVVSSAINCISDLMIFILPQVRIWRLQMVLCKKVAFFALFSIGLVACISSVVKLAYAVIKVKTLPDNTSYHLYLVGLWTLPELAGGIIAGCLPSTTKAIQGLARIPRVLKWRSSLCNLIASSTGRDQSDSGATHLCAAMPKPRRIIRNSSSGADQFPLSTFASLPGTVDETARTIHSTHSTTSFPGKLG
ncbi:hypothetical protein BJX76DRAFT_364496 [Aspergillus varians]